MGCKNLPQFTRLAITGLALAALGSCDASLIGPEMSPRGPQGLLPQIAFLSLQTDRSSTSELNIVNIDGSGGRRLTFTNAHHSGHVWSPDASGV